MLGVVVQSLPIVCFVALGFVLKQVRLVRRDDGHAIMRLLISTTLPALVFVSLACATVEHGGLLLLALCGAAIPLLTHPLAMLMARRMRLERKVAGVMVISTMASSVAMFLFPFFQLFYGAEGLSYVVAFNLGNSLEATTYTYYVAARYGEGENWHWRVGVEKLLAMPLLWANVLGVVVNWAGIRLPDVLMDGLQTLSAANLPLAMVALGLFIDLHFARWKPILVIMALRVGFGWLVAQALILSLGLTGVQRVAASVGTLAPIGATIMAYTSVEGLDETFFAAAMSVSILAALVLTPLAIGLYH